MKPVDFLHLFPGQRGDVPAAASPMRAQHTSFGLRATWQLKFKWHYIINANVEARARGTI